MWHEGTIKILQEDGSTVLVEYQLKCYGKGSPSGINGGRISKLRLQMDGRPVANYERGWTMEPTCEAARLALRNLMEAYN